MTYQKYSGRRWRILIAVLFVFACILGGFTAKSAVAEANLTTGEILPIFRLDNPNGIAEGGFGFSIDGVGDINGDSVPDIVVGAYKEDIGGVNSVGQAYIFSGADKSLIHILRNPYTQNVVAFGSSVSGIGDVNNDTIPDVAVGAPSQRPRGKVFVFSGANGGLLYVLNNPYPDRISSFGKRISGGEDINGDTVPDFFVGGYGIWSSWAGKLFAFSGIDGSMIYAVDDPSVTPTSGSFGDRVDMIGDVDGDSVADVIVGAWEHESYGQAFVFSGASGSLLYRLDHPDPLIDPSILPWYGFGRGVAGIGDVDGDSVPDVVVGASGDYGSYEYQGRAFVFSGKDGAYLYPLDHPEPIIYGGFGATLDAIGDYNGDGRPDIVVSARANQRTYIFSGADGTFLSSFPGGRAVAAIGDITGDGHSDVAVEKDWRVTVYNLHHSSAGSEPVSVGLVNPNFEDDSNGWSFHTNGAGNFLTVDDPYSGQWAASIQIESEGSNVQLYQKGIALEPNQHYRLSFAAYASNGNDLSIYLHKHQAPYTDYGVREWQVDLTDSWPAEPYVIEFTTKGFSTAVNDARLRFWFGPYDEAGMTYRIDNISLEKVTDGEAPVPDPEPSVPKPGIGNCESMPGNVVDNSGFEENKARWGFYSSGQANFNISASAYECEQSAHIAVTNEGNNVQLYQKLALEPHTTYYLRLAAKSNHGEDVALYVHEHTPPNANLGLNGVRLDLTEEWQVFLIRFTTKGFDQPINDARLRIWMAEFDQAGTEYWFDDIVMWPVTDNSVAASAISSTADLISGYFIDNDDAGRLAGSFILNESNGDGLSEYIFLPLLSIPE